MKENDRLSRHPYFYWVACIMYASLIFILSSLPALVEFPMGSVLDKVVHAAEFGFLSLLLFYALRSTFFKTSIYYLALIALGLSILYGVIDEYHQFFTPNRHSDPLDLVADALGAVITQGLILLKITFRS